MDTTYICTMVLIIALVPMKKYERRTLCFV